MSAAMVGACYDFSNDLHDNCSDFRTEDEDGYRDD
jgi:hypothetical protein